MKHASAAVSGFVTSLSPKVNKSTLESRYLLRDNDRPSSRFSAVWRYGTVALERELVVCDP